MSIDPTQCPLCQANNRCAVQQGKGIEQCWCVLQPFPSKSILEEEKLSLEASASRACLCQSCIQKLKTKEENQLYKQVD